MTDPEPAAASPLKPEVLVLGAGGMLGQAVVQRLACLYIPHLAAPSALCDVTDAASCHNLISRHTNATVINCAAYTDVNGAETHQDQAFQINAVGAGNVATACAKANSLCIYISTDYVFPGTAGRPYEVNDPTGPLNVYGHSKLAGEQATAAAAPSSLIVRTSWLYGAGGRNFVKTMLRCARDKKDISVINDQRGTPTYVVDLATALVELSRTKTRGVVHAAASGDTSWFEFATAIFEEAAIHPASLTPVSTDAYPSAAARPRDSRLSMASLEAAGISRLPHWRHGLKRYLTEIACPA